MTERLIHAGLATWQVDRSGTITKRAYNDRLLAIGYTHDQIAAIDIMTDDDVPLEKAAELALAATKKGESAEGFARHFVKLRKAFRGAA